MHLQKTVFPNSKVFKDLQADIWRTAVLITMSCVMVSESRRYLVGYANIPYYKKKGWWNERLEPVILLWTSHIGLYFFLVKNCDDCALIDFGNFNSGFAKRFMKTCFDYKAHTVHGFGIY
jgi:hypothetical protein